MSCAETFMGENASWIHRSKLRSMFNKLSYKLVDAESTIDLQNSLIYSRFCKKIMIKGKKSIMCNKISYCKRIEDPIFRVRVFEFAYINLHEILSLLNIIPHKCCINLEWIFCHKFLRTRHFTCKSWFQ